MGEKREHETDSFGRFRRAFVPRRRTHQTVVILSLLVGAVLAFSLVAPPGPMNAVIAEESVFRGWTAGFRAGMGAFVADAVFCVLAFSGAATLARSPTVRAAMALAGGFIMVYLAYLAVREARSATTVAGGSRGFLKALVLGLTNPYQIGWWLTAGVALVYPSPVEVLGITVVTGGPEVLVGFFGGILVWITVFPAALVRAETRLGRFEKWVGYASAAVLVVFGAVFVYYALTVFAPFGSSAPATPSIP
jgi:threonine/homoserine/homoserine lactone efflux protein